MISGISRAFDPGDGGAHNNFYLSETLVEHLKGPDKGSVADDDPRMMIFTGGIGLWTPGNWTPLETDPLKQKGMPNGLEHADLVAIEGNPDLIEDETYSKLNVLALDDDDPYQVMNYAETAFLMAEAIERGIGGASGDAKAQYESGVWAAMQQYTPLDASFVVSDGAVDAYLAAFPYGVTKPALEMIYDQLWVNGWFNWWEAWSNFRRTGFPKLTPTSHPNRLTDVIPTRLRYPESEVATNVENMQAGTSPNEYDTKVWWDVKD